LIAIAICVALQLLLTYVPFMQVLFGTQSLDASAWAGCIAVGFVIFVLVEVEKFVRRSYLSRESQA
jgi:magnesium-transporting ATPase (P-type)